MNKFEIGKFYKHTTNAYLAVLGEVESTQWGKTLIAESPNEPSGFIPLENFYNKDEWMEVSEEEWRSLFSDAKIEESKEPNND